MRSTGTKKWIIVLVAIDDVEIPARVLKEQIDADEDPKLAAFLRGGELVQVVDVDNEGVAELEREAFEKRCLR